MMHRSEVTTVRRRLCSPVGRIRSLAAVVIVGAAVLLPVTAVAAPPQFLISPTGLDFGSVAVGTTGATQSVSVTNVSGSPLLMNGTGGAAGVFGGSQDCQGHTLAAGASCHMYYAFTPTSVGPVTGGGGGTWNGQEFRVAMTGTGAASAPAPTVIEIHPKSGPAAGGTSVKIMGGWFAGVTAVMFGPVPAKTFTLVSGTEIKAVSPAEGAAVHNIRVITAAGGTSAKVIADRFTFR
jgi:hypothetical protein